MTNFNKDDELSEALPPNLRTLPRIPERDQFGCIGIKKLIPENVDDVYKLIVTSANIEMIKGTLVDDLFRELLSDLIDRVKNIKTSWRWKAMKTLPQNMTDVKEFIKQCKLEKEHISKLVDFVFETLIPKDLLGEHNKHVFIDWISSNIFLLKPFRHYPPFKILDSTPLRATRSKVFRSQIPEYCDVQIFQTSMAAGITNFCLWFPMTCAVQFIQIFLPRTLSETTYTFYSKRSFNFWKRREIKQFRNDYQLVRVPFVPEVVDKASISNLRIIARTSNLRPICPYDKRADWTYTNCLQLMNEALDYYIDHSSFMKIEGVFQTMRRVKSFLALHRRSNPKKKLFYIKADVTKCFASLQHDLLKSILENIVKSRIPIVFDYSYFGPCTVAYRLASGLNGRFFRIYSAGSSRSDAERNLLKTMEEKNCLVKCEGTTEFVEFNDFVPRLMSVVQGLRFRIDSKETRLFKMEKGVPQGFMLSSRLSHIYLSSFDVHQFADLNHGSAMFRYADDYLFILSSKEEAIKMLDRIQRPVNPYSLIFRQEKTQTSFTSIVSKKMGRHILWCGNTIDTQQHMVLPKRMGFYTTHLVFPKNEFTRMRPFYRIKLRRMLRMRDKKAYQDSGCQQPVTSH